MEREILVTCHRRILGSHLIQNKQKLNQKLCTPISLMDTHIIIILHKNPGFEKPFGRTKKDQKRNGYQKIKYFIL